MAGHRRQRQRQVNSHIKHHVLDKKKYCTGCGRLFDKTHELLSHRYSFRCGGLFRIEQELEVPWARPRLVDPRPNGVPRDHISLQERRRLYRRRKGYHYPGEVRPGHVSDVPGGKYCKSKQKYFSQGTYNDIAKIRR